MRARLIRVSSAAGFATAAILSLSAVCSAACRPGDPTGYFEGTAQSKEAGALHVALNLRCESGRYAGELVTPVGTFAIHDGAFNAGQMSLRFGGGAIGDDGAVTLKVSGDDATGAFQLAADSGPFTVKRLGEARAPANTDPDLGISAALWHQDLVFLASTLATRHVNAFRYTPRPAFDGAVAALDGRLRGLGADAIYVGLDNIATRVGDGHTYVEFPPDAARFPFLVRRFGKDYRVAAVAGENRAALGTRIVKIGDTPVQSAYDALFASITPIAETEALRDARAQDFLGLGLPLHGLGIIPDRAVAPFTFARDDGSTFTATLQAARAGRVIAWTWPWKSAPLYRQRPDEDFWYTFLAPNNTVYCSFRGYKDLQRNAAGLLTLVRERKPEKLVIDLRQNGGGDYKVGLASLIQPVAAIPAINQTGHLFVLVGVNTFSAAMSNAAQFRTQTKALLVGQMIGERPNSYQEANEVRLPNSHLLLRYSTQEYAFLPGADAIVPDQTIEPTWAEYAAGRDPVLEWVLSRR